MSSIIPSRERHHFNNIIAPSNQSLREACVALEVSLADNHDTFVTVNGVPALPCLVILHTPALKAGTASAGGQL